MNNKSFYAAAALAQGLLFSSIGLASDQVGTITQIEGDVRVFSHPSRQLQKEEGAHVLYEGEYFLVEPAKVGAKVDQGNLLRTAPGAKARVVFENGDQLNVGPATAMRVFWNKDASDAKTKMELAYGKLRGVVEKGGPRSHMMIRTRTATMGVRGTDFFIADGGADGGTEVSIMRGSVEVTPKAANAKPVEVKQGFSAAIPPAPPVTEAKTAAKADGNADAKSESKAEAKPAPMQPVVELRQTTQEELKGIQRSSTIEKKAEAAAAEPAPPEVAKLEKKAVETALHDIKTYDPKLYAQLEAKKPASTDEINAQVVHELIKEAPRAPEKHKPFKSEVDNLEQGAYEKYFKTQD